jgi:hypothetical protein
MPDKRNAYRMLNPYADTHDYFNCPLLVLHCPVRTLHSHLKYRLCISSGINKNCLAVTFRWTNYREHELVHPVMKVFIH